MSYLLCIDVGSSVCKSIIYDTEFKEVAREYQEIPTQHPRPRWAEQEPEDWWKAVVETTGKILEDRSINPQDIAGVAVCGQGHGPVLLDKSGRSLFACIVWSDLRAIGQAEHITRKLRRESSVYFTAAKLLWIKENCPEIFERMHKFVLPKDFVRLKLTDKILTDIADAEGTMMYSASKGQWDYELVNAAGLPREKLPRIYASDSIIGEITKKGAAATGLQEGTKVIAGAPDYQGTQIGLGDSLKTGRAIVYLGSAPSIFTVTKRGQYKGDFMGIGGASLKWFKEEFCFPPSSSTSYTYLDEEAKHIEPCSDGVMFFPHMMGERSPTRNPHSRAVLFGLSMGHKRGHIIRAMMEGVAFQLRLISDFVLPDQETKEILAIGGGARSTVWRQIVADVFMLPVCFPDREEISTLGLAILLSKGLGIYKNISEAQKRAILRIVGKTKPRKDLHQKYEKMLTLYNRLENTFSHFFNSKLENIEQDSLQKKK